MAKAAKKAKTKTVKKAASPKAATPKKTAKSKAAKPVKAAAAKKPAVKSDAPSRLIDKRIKELSDWRGTTLSMVRSLILEADPQIAEDWKWRGVPVWYREGMICTGETYKSVVKVTFAKGAQLKDPSKLFNSSLEGNARRAIDIHEGEKLDAAAFKTLVREAIALNTSSRKN